MRFGLTKMAAAAACVGLLASASGCSSKGNAQDSSQVAAAAGRAEEAANRAAAAAASARSRFTSKPSAQARGAASFRGCGLSTLKRVISRSPFSFLLAPNQNVTIVLIALRSSAATRYAAATSANGKR